MKILAIDPGNEQSAYVLMDADTLRPVCAEILPNEDMLDVVRRHNRDCRIVIEMVASYGMAVGKTVFETVFWIGRFYEAAGQYVERDRVYRMDVKMNLCHSSRANDANIRQALIDRFGPTGTKKNPGWFYGFKKDLWAAYAVGVTYADNPANWRGE